jgi:hypothetical protein
MIEVHPLRLLVKALVLFFIVNVIYALVDPPITVSAYNSVFPGRVRLPFGDYFDPHIVQVDNVDVMFASHEIARRKQENEIRVVLIGDSAIWGESIPVHLSMSRVWNDLGAECNGKRAVFYNLGYPHPSVIKDLVMIEKAQEFEPDLYVWFITMNTVMPRRVNPFLKANVERTTRILEAYNLSVQGSVELEDSMPTFFDKTLVGRRSLLARWIRLQALGIIWTVTGVDFSKTEEQTPSISYDVSSDLIYLGMGPSSNLSKKILFDALQAGHDLAGSVPILLVNSPVFVAKGLNSDLRYNDAYPRWAYDQFREATALQADKTGWNYLDMWDAVPGENFLNALHFSAEGEKILANEITPTLFEFLCK